MKKIVKYDPLTGKNYYGDLNLPTQIEYIQDNWWYTSAEAVVRYFPETFDLEIGKKYIMHFGFVILPGATWRHFVGQSDISLIENGQDIMLSIDGTAAMGWAVLNVNLAPMEIPEIFSWGSWHQAAKVITATEVIIDDVPVGKVLLKFFIRNGYDHWRIASEGAQSWIEFIKIENNT